MFDIIKFQNPIVDHGGRLVKYGYVVFAEKAVAQKIIKESLITFTAGVKVSVQQML